MRSWYSITAKSAELAEIVIYDEIGFFGITAKDFLDELKTVENRRIKLRLNCPGGDVFEGLAIYNRLKDHAPGVEVWIDGLAASMGSVIAMVGAPVKIAANAMIMIHNPNGLVAGDADDMRGMAEVLDKVRAGLLNAYERKTGLGSAKLTAMLDAETWLTAAEAKTLGFADEITDSLKIAARFDSAKFRNVPPQYQAMKPLRTSILALLALSETPEKPLSDEQICTEITTKLGAITALVTERDSLKAERDKISGQYAELTKEANQAKQDLVTEQGKVTALTSDRDALSGKLVHADSNVTRLEALCGIKGVDPKAAVPAVPEQTSGTHVYDKWQAATGAEKTQLFRAHKTDIRIEGERRAGLKK